VAVAPFFSGVRKDAPPPILVNARTQGTLAGTVEIARTSETRRRGLLGRDSLAPSTALVIAPCSAVHTFFMRFAIDVVFIDRRGRVLKIVRNLKPWRIAGSLRAYGAVEMAAGSVPEDALVSGDNLSLLVHAR
jgi:uncharacterized membrane protein (UPF0127 family)